VLEESEKSDSQEKKAHTTSPGFEIIFKVSKSMQIINFSGFLNELFVLLGLTFL